MYSMLIVLSFSLDTLKEREIHTLQCFCFVEEVSYSCYVNYVFYLFFIFLFVYLVTHNHIHYEQKLLTEL